MLFNKVLIGGICIFIAGSLLLEVAYTNSRADLRISKVRAIGEKNTEQAEYFLKACIRDSYFILGEDIYMCQTQKTGLKSWVL